MTKTGCKHCTIVISTLIVVLAGLAGAACWQYGVLKLHVAFASEQTYIFSQMRTKALQSDAAGAASCLQYVVFYYPSGTKQRAGSQLDSIVERERFLTVRDILQFLRAKTSEDLGTKAEPWIRKYANK